MMKSDVIEDLDDALDLCCLVIVEGDFPKGAAYQPRIVADLRLDHTRSFSSRAVSGDHLLAASGFE